jgi:putative addiction module CopG family antidote
MTTCKTMDLSLTPELELFVTERVASDLYRSASEVVRAALRLLKEENKSGEQKGADNQVTAMQKAGGPFVAAAERTRMPMVFSDPQLPGNPIVYANDSFLALTGYDREEVLGRSYHFMMGLGTDPAAPAQIDAALHDSYDAYPEVRYYRKDGSEFWAAIFISPIFDENHTVVQHFASFLDITRRKRDEDRNQLLVEELDHRLKNTLATVQSIAAQTLRNAAVEQPVRDAFEGRLLALSKAHGLLAHESWNGVGLRDLIDQTLQPFGIKDPRPARFSVEGGDVRPPPKAALALAMVFHELATNAAKYGSLSNGGQIGITWQDEPTPQGARMIRLRWQESGGPPVMPPGRKGFGSRLIEGGLAHELDGEVHLNYEPEGVVCQIVMPALAGLGHD